MPPHDDRKRSPLCETAQYNRPVPEETTAKPGTGRTVKSARTRARILDATAHVLSRKGYAGTRLSGIAEQAQLQAPAIYYYFPSREDLIEEVMWTGIQRLREHVTEALEELPAGTPPMERIAVAVREHLRLSLELSDYATAVIRNSSQVPEEMRVRQLAEETAYGALWQKLIKDAAAEGEIRADLDPQIAHRLVLGALNWAAEWWNPRRDSFETVVRTATSLVHHGLSSRSRLGEPEA